MNHSHTFLSSMLLLLAISPGYPDQNMVTQTGGPITKISYSTTGGRAGNAVSLEITAGSLIYVQGHRGTEKTIREKTSRGLWTSLTKAINTRDIDGIKSNPGHALYDGTDITITVEAGKKVHTIVNGNEDSLKYRRIKAFTDILDGELRRLEKKIHW